MDYKIDFKKYVNKETKDTRRMVNAHSKNIKCRAQEYCIKQRNS